MSNLDRKMKPIHSIYISHTSVCSGWDIDKIFSRTIYKKACSVSRFPKEENNIKMLDWDFRGVLKKGFEQIWENYFEIVKNYSFDVVFCPDSYVKSDPEKIVDYYYKLKEYVGRVVVPVHGWFKLYEIEELELAYPNAENFNRVPKNYWIWDIMEQFTHILGGSPHKQFELKQMLPNVVSFDGNQMFNCAIYSGKYWKNGKWISPGKDKNDCYIFTNEELFVKSLTNFEDFLAKKCLRLNRYE